MIKQVHVFLLFLKIGENSFLFSKNCFLFHFILKNYFKKTTVLEFFKNNLYFYEQKNCF